jgi:hypothetical protein
MRKNASDIRHFPKGHKNENEKKKRITRNMMRNLNIKREMMVATNENANVNLAMNIRMNAKKNAEC